MAENGLEHALKAIDPVARAMLDLSIRRRLPDSSIADLAQMPPDELVRWRGEVLDQLATQIGLTGPGAREEVRARLESVDATAWVGSGAAKSQPPQAPATPPAQPSESKPPVERQQPSRRLLGLLGLVVVLVIIVAIISLSGGDDSGDTEPLPTTLPTTSTTTKPTSTTTEQTSTEQTSTTTKPTSTTTTSTTTTPSTPPVTMDPLPGMPDRGTATVSVQGKTLTVELKGMPEPNGVYELWLFNTIIGAQPLGSADSGNAKITAELPSDAGDFRYLDLSREEDADDTVHSGISIRRTELAPLLTSPDG
jgi:hypothetical protein